MKVVEETKIDFSGKNWRERKFRYPNRTINLATTFSGIGAIEYALKFRLGLNCQIQFAGDIDRNCMLAYQHNYGISPSIWHTDVRDFHADSFKGKVDLAHKLIYNYTAAVVPWTLHIIVTPNDAQFPIRMRMD